MRTERCLSRTRFSSRKMLTKQTSLGLWSDDNIQKNNGLVFSPLAQPCPSSAGQILHSTQTAALFAAIRSFGGGCVRVEGNDTLGGQLSGGNVGMEAACQVSSEMGVRLQVMRQGRQRRLQVLSLCARHGAGSHVFFRSMLRWATLRDRERVWCTSAGKGCGANATWRSGRASEGEEGEREESKGEKREQATGRASQSRSGGQEGDGGNEREERA